jgi:hypothetical protein
VLRRPLLLAAPCLALVLGTVVGCGHDDKPYAGPLPSKSSASPTPTKARTATPTKPTAQGAVATARQAIAAINTLYAKQDGRPLRAVSHVSCGECESFFHAVTTKKARGYRFSGGEITVRGRVTYSGLKKSTMTAGVTTPVAVAELRVTDPSGNRYDSATDPAASEPAHSRGALRWILWWDGKKWLVQGFSFEDV